MGSTTRRKSLKSIKSQGWRRNLALGKLTLFTGVRSASHVLSSWVGGRSSESSLQLLIDQANQIAAELGVLKGSLMKMGQMLSVLGEHFLPPQVNEILKQLQNQSPQLDWPGIEKTLNKQLSPELRAQLEIEPEALACASMGQVHLARWKKSREAPVETVALKVQYPGVAKAIDSDVRTLRFILNMANLIPGEINLDPIFAEVRTMLRQELDYKRELRSTQKFRELLAGDSRFVVPEPFAELCTNRIIATRFEPGCALDSEEVSQLPQLRRNQLAINVLELYLRELFVWHTVQTDPHFGNYRVRIHATGEDQLILFDFGAVRTYPKSFMSAYATMIHGLLMQDRAEMLSGAEAMGFLRPGDPPELGERFAEFCELIVEPFSEQAGVYHWGESDLPQRLLKAASGLIRSFHLRTPPRELVFLDRKTAGVFTLLAKLRAQFSGREMVLSYVSAGIGHASRVNRHEAASS